MLNHLRREFIRNILGTHRETGARWIISLPQLIGEIERAWSLKIGKPFPDLSYHFVAPCVSLSGAGEAVLKIAVPEPNSPIFKEKKMLEIFDGSGAVKLLRFDERRHAMLLEKLDPGENLVKICQTDDARSTAIAIEMMRRLMRETVALEDFPALEDWVGGLKKAEGTIFAPRMVGLARDYFAELIGSEKKNYLLHGDLHHQNILSARRAPYLAIDPKGIVGALGFEISTFLNNPRGWVLSQPDRKRILSARLRQFAAAFGIEPEDLRRWAYAEAVLSAWWTFEETRAVCRKGIACAEIWEDYKV